MKGSFELNWIVFSSSRHIRFQFTLNNHFRRVFSKQYSKIRKYSTILRTAFGSVENKYSFWLVSCCRRNFFNFHQNEYFTDVSAERICSQYEKEGKKSSSTTKVFQSYWSWSFSEESGKSVVLHLVYLKRQFGCVRGDNHPVARIISFCSPICFWWCRISFVSLSPSLTRLHTGTLTFSVCEDEFTVLCMSCLLKWI